MSFVPTKSYRVKLTTNNSNCSLNDTYEFDFEAISCSTTIPDDKNPVDIVQTATIFEDQLDVSLDLDYPGSLDLYMIEVSSGMTYLLEQNHNYFSSGVISMSYNLSGMNSGTYQPIAVYDAGVDTKMLVKP